ncbi:MAG: HD domain-containing protein [Chloroflexi bacterium]|nr:MAG: HD domain-containing protein [Chloroflexota bacterium]
MNVDKYVVEKAAEHAAALLSPLGKRWRHVQGVVQRAYSVRTLFEEEDQQYLIAAAYLHDIGYAPSLNKTAFHPLDGANYVIQFFRDVRLASLVAHHSEATFEARLRGYAHALHAFPCEYSAVADALTFCDMTTSPEGKHISFEERIAEILYRYKENDIVFQSILQATPALSLDIERTEKMLRKHERNTFDKVGAV